SRNNVQLLLVLLLFMMTMMLDVSLADVYLHSPPGSNDRNQEPQTNRENDNRLFNSQNNAKGGYCRGGILTWYEKSYLPIEWTNQHGCGSDQTTCNLILQYMCTERTGDPMTQVRDGTTVDNLDADNITAIGAVSGGAGTDFVYGMHESYYHYTNCTTRARNQGLFTANKTLDDSARFTRQNEGGDQYGWECPEERDYYPYWAPSPWKDIAIFTGDTDQCSLYQRESQNVRSKFYCVLPGVGATRDNLAPITEVECTAQNGKWMEQRAWGMSAPECLKAEWNHVNHLGLSMSSGRYNSYNWSLPSQSMEPCIAMGTCQCVLRIRYNISSAEIVGFGRKATDYKNNHANSPIFDDLQVPIGDKGHSLALNIDEAQYGRTFQDRSHVFSIKSRPANLKDAKIWNLLVKGKRGNIVDAYPAIEYQFAPSQLHVKINEHVHFQWTGCDFNPEDNAGNGAKKLDRSNIIQIHSLNQGIPFKESDYTKDNALFPDPDVRERFAFLDQVGCLSQADLVAKHGEDKGAIETDPQNCAYLNAASNTFDGEVHQMDRVGSYYFMSTRNNEFSNRDQKGAIHVDPLLWPWQIALIGAGSALFVALVVSAGALAYARTHPHSGANRFFSRVPGVRKIV
ncbi:hypothetical protein SAMD00019534_116260, partial [Acytostelium subglobosum LB1]|uniref:hypothetical protein n=1 Tax=Acytostelium subglobosum LB1 TaxID=1410327 RepID=UPI000644D9C9